MGCGAASTKLHFAARARLRSSSNLGRAHTERFLQVIQLTQCASRAAGFACAFWLILFGVIGKIGAAFSSIPICVVGGVVLQCFAMVFVSGMNIATRHATRRNNYILMVALALGIGVGMEPQLFEGGGPAAFYGGNLRHNIGFWPRHKTCDVFPSVTTTNTVTPASCDLEGYIWTSGDEAFETTCADLGGVYAAAVTEDVTETVKTCTNNNGFSAASCGGDDFREILTGKTKRNRYRRAW